MTDDSDSDPVAEFRGLPSGFLDPAENSPAAGREGSPGRSAAGNGILRNGILRNGILRNGILRNGADWAIIRWAGAFRAPLRSRPQGLLP